MCKVNHQMHYQGVEKRELMEERREVGFIRDVLFSNCVTSPKVIAEV